MALISDYGDDPTAFYIFAATMGGISLLEVLLFRYAEARGHLRERLTPEVVRYGTIASTAPVAIVLLSLPVAYFISPSLALASWLLMFPVGYWIGTHPPESVPKSLAAVRRGLHREGALTPPSFNIADVVSHHTNRYKDGKITDGRGSRAMRIEDVSTRVFRTTTRRHADTAGHAHPGPAHQVETALLTIRTDTGDEGYCFSPPQIVREHVLDKFVRKVLIGADPFDREKLWQELAHWQRGSAAQLTDRTLAIVDCALWDLAGRALEQPVHKLIGAYRDKVPAYGSIMCGDELEGGLATPDDYARFCEKLVARGYKGIKLHTWMPPVSWAPDVKMDLKACAAAREAVGPDIHLMIDAFHWYSRTEALELGRGLEKLGFAWIEEPLDEQSMSTYAWLADNLDIPVLGPESAAGKHFARAEWIKAGACDILRTGVHDVGGITPALKSMRLAESFGMNCEVHGNGAENLMVTAVSRNCRWYERGLLHPFLEYDDGFDYLKSLADPMDADGFVHLPDRPGLGLDIDFDFINANLVA